MKKFRRSSIVIILFIASVFALSKCANEEDKATETIVPTPGKKVIARTLTREQFVGSSSCAGCHKDIYDQHIRTGHFKSTQPATPKTVMGSFVNGKNRYNYNPDLYMAMEKRDTGIYQVVFFKGEEKKVLPFHMVIGSGSKGQSYMYWLNKRLFQLPITFFTVAKQWVNSPGFPPRVQFDRPITSRCLECHTTFVNTTTPAGTEPEEFDRDRMILGVDCEKCHGPAADHVTYHTKNPSDSQPHHIINPAHFSRQQKLDACALCHAGNIQKTQPSFSFLPGDTLSDYFRIDSLPRSAIESGEIDVHGNKLGVLKASKCFIRSEMTCNSCHGPHGDEKDNLVLYSKKCMSCHVPGQEHFCKMDPKVVPTLMQNCIDCHMPIRQSRSIVLFTYDDEVPIAALFRSHYIGIYGAETKQFIDNKGKKMRNVR
jgi:hypothetical protein